MTSIQQSSVKHNGYIFFSSHKHTKIYIDLDYTR